MPPDRGSAESRHRETVDGDDSTTSIFEASLSPNDFKFQVLLRTEIPGSEMTVTSSQLGRRPVRSRALGQHPARAARRVAVMPTPGPRSKKNRASNE
jgi:hypothetical protein